MKRLAFIIAAIALLFAQPAQAIDIIVQATTQAQIYTALKSRGLAQDVTDAGGQTVTVPVQGVDNFVWWQESGKFMTAAPVLDAQDNVVTPPTFLPGFVMLIRITDPSDIIANPVDGEQWSRSRVVQFIKNNGTPGTLSISGCSPINYYALNNLKVTRFADVQACLTTLNLPGHEWAGGNQP